MNIYTLKNLATFMEIYTTRNRLLFDTFHKVNTSEGYLNPIMFLGRGLDVKQFGAWTRITAPLFHKFLLNLPAKDFHYFIEKANSGFG